MFSKYTSRVMAKYESDIEVCGQRVHYQVYGTGKHALLLFPGSLGTAETDYYLQVNGTKETSFNLKKYQVVVMELPGWGRSRPPKRNYFGNENVFTIDARCAIELMNHLGHKLFSVIGWSEGSKLALLMAVLYSSRILSVVTVSRALLKNFFVDSFFD